MTLYNQDLTVLNTFGLKAQAKTLHLIQDEADLEKFFQDNPDRWFTLGGGSNLLLSRDLDEPVVKMEIKGIKILSESETDILLQVGAGEVWHELVLYTIDQNWGGLENLSLIPGSVGAAPIQNIGAYGIEVASVIEKVRYFDIEKKSWQEIEGKVCAFGYRDSIFKGQLKGKVIITAVYFRLKKAPHTLHIDYGAIRDQLRVKNLESYTIKDVSDAVIQIRQSKLPDPKKIGNSGSFFKNPVITHETFNQIKELHPDIPFYNQLDGVKIPAAWLIEQCGWKGWRKENYGVHEKQALVLVNYGGASGQDIWSLSEEIIQSVFIKFNILLEREVQVI